MSKKSLFFLYLVSSSLATNVEEVQSTLLRQNYSICVVLKILDTSNCSKITRLCSPPAGDGMSIM